MAYWYGNRMRETYTYRRVSWATWQELEDYTNITGGSIELSEFSDMRAIGSLHFEGGAAPDETDLLRVYYGFTDDYGESETVCLATFFVATTSTANRAEYRGGADAGLVASGDVTCSSVLKVLLDKLTGFPVSVPAGTNAVQFAAGLITSLGLQVSATPSAYTLPQSHTFEEGTPYLTVINKLLSFAGYGAAVPDAYGVVQLRKYVEPTKRTAALTFRNDAESIMYPQVTDESDWQSTPNVVRLTYITDEECLYAVAANVDAQSRASLVNRGNREITLQETVDELAGDTRQERIANLISKAKKTLADNSADIQYLNMSHAYVPLQMGDAVDVLYSNGFWSGTAVGATITLSPGAKTDLRIRMNTVQQLATETDGGVVWAS